MPLPIANRFHHSHLVLIMLQHVPHHYSRIGAHEQRRIFRAPSVLLHQMLDLLIEKTQRRDEQKSLRLMRRGDVSSRSELNPHEMLLFPLLPPGPHVLLRQIHDLRSRREQQPRDLASDPQMGLVIHVVARFESLGHIEAQIAENRAVLRILEGDAGEVGEDAEHEIATTENLVNVVGCEPRGVAHAARERLVPLEVAAGRCEG